MPITLLKPIQLYTIQHTMKYKMSLTLRVNIPTHCYSYKSYTFWMKTASKQHKLNAITYNVEILNKMGSRTLQRDCNNYFLWSITCLPTYWVCHHTCDRDFDRVVNGRNGICSIFIGIKHYTLIWVILLVSIII